MQLPAGSARGVHLPLHRLGQPDLQLRRARQRRCQHQRLQERRGGGSDPGGEWVSASFSLLLFPDSNVLRQ